MTDYLGPLTLGGTADTYDLQTWERTPDGASIEVIVHGTTPATLTTALEALAAQLAIGNTYAHTFPGAASPTVFTIAGAAAMTTDEQVGPQNYWARCKFSLSLSPHPAGALTTLYNAEHVNSPASLSLATLLGTHPTQLDVTIDDDSGNDMHSVWCALAPTAVSDAKWRVKASSLTWTTMSNGTGATDSWVDGTTRYTTSSTWQTAPLDTAAYPQGKYKLLVHVKQSAGTGYVKDSQNDSAVAITRTTMHIMEIGDLDLPVSDTAPGTASNLTISVASDGTNTLTVDAFLLIPLDYGMFRWHHDTVTSEIDQLDVGPSGIFMDGATDTTYLRGGILVPRIMAAHVGTLVATPEPSGSVWPTDWFRTDAVDVTASSSTFLISTTAGSKYARYAATDAATPLVVPGAWYEVTCTRSVTARTAGAAVVNLIWRDIDLNMVRLDELSSTSTTDASPVALELYAKAPAHAARCQVRVGAGAGANLTVAFYDVVLRRCPLRLIVAAEDAGGALVSNYHPVHVSVKYRPMYEVAR